MSRRRVIPDATEAVPGQLTLDGQEVATPTGPTTGSAEPVRVRPYRGRGECSVCWEDQALAHASGGPVPRRHRATLALHEGDGREPQLLCEDHAVQLAVQHADQAVGGVTR